MPSVTLYGALAGALLAALFVDGALWPMVAGVLLGGAVATFGAAAWSRWGTS